VNPFAGNWSTFAGTGRLHLQVVDAATGQSAVAGYSGGSASCPSQTLYYGDGTYSVGQGQDVGRLAGCTDGTGRHLIAWYRSDIGPQHGTISIDAGSDDTTFSGTYKELSDGSSGAYEGTFIGDFVGSGRTRGGCSLARTLAAAGRAADVVRVVSVKGFQGEVDVEIVRADGTTCKAKPGDELGERDRIRTGYKSEVTLDFGGKATVIVEEMTDFRLSVFKTGDITDVELWLKAGGVAAQVTRDVAAPTSFRVKSPTVTASVRGTVFSVGYDPRTGVSIVDVTKNTVDVLPTKGLSATPPRSRLPEVTVRAGKEVLVSASKESPLAAIGRAGVPAGQLSRPAAVALVERAVSKNRSRCGLKATGISAVAGPHGWTVSIQVATRAGAGWAAWTITGRKLTPANPLARRITAGCAGAAAGKAKPGHYSGQTTDSKPVSFDVSADRTNVTNLSAAGKVVCADSSQWTWALTSSSNSPISPKLSFSHSHNGPLTINDNTITNLNLTATITGILTTTGTATGSFQISHISWDQSGTHYDCTGASTSWTAKVAG
jgi:hypothetical protein